MNIVVDLHSHSPYAGASGKVDFNRLSFVMGVKGIDVYGSGDILLKKWEDELDGEFAFNKKAGMWEMKPSAQGVSVNQLFLVPQTEVIVTLPYLHDPQKRKLFHLVIIFNGRQRLNRARELFLKAGSKLGIGRPFVKFDSASQMCGFFRRFKEETESILVPAHIMTPDGILGGKNRVEKIEDVFGEDISLIDAVESGLSADPDMIKKVAGSLNVPIISSSDAHSAAFNRLGREFSEISVDEISASAIIEAIKKGNIVKTAEFPPFEGRYYLTGHRGDRPGHNGEEIFFEENPLEVCPVCGKHFTLGVKELAAKLYSSGRERKQKFVYQMPLVEIAAQTIGQGAASKKVTEIYLDIIKQTGRESIIWLDDEDVKLKGEAGKITESIKKIKKGDYKINYGFDGKYGEIIF